MNTLKSDYIIIGSGIMGLSIAYAIKEKFPHRSIIIIDKEKYPAYHASGRNSGVLHAGFYYSPDSLKAKFTKEGNIFWTKFCDEHHLKINKCGKVVVTKNEKELETLQELYSRGIQNGVELKIIDDKELMDIEPNAKTFKKAIYSPTTSTIDPVEIASKLREILNQKKVKFQFNTKFLKKETEGIRVNTGTVIEGKVINCAGLYADKIAKQYGLAREYEILPFRGNYLLYNNIDKPISTLIYPVPDINFPFLGVHFTITVDNKIKIGPTATPALWKEHYQGFKNFKIDEFTNIIKYNLKLLKASSKFRKLGYEEIKKISKNYLIYQSSQLVKYIDKSAFRNWSKPGIRAQLFNKITKQLEMDFIIQTNKESIHILNAVSPAFTASIPFAKWIVEKYLN